MRITSKKVFIEKVKSGLKLESLKEYKRTLYYLTNYKDIEITVSISLIKSLENDGTIDENLDINTNKI